MVIIDKLFKISIMVNCSNDQNKQLKQNVSTLIAHNCLVTVYLYFNSICILIDVDITLL